MGVRLSAGWDGEKFTAGARTTTAAETADPVQKGLNLPPILCLREEKGKRHSCEMCPGY